jgi:hypothetical protein
MIKPKTYNYSQNSTNGTEEKGKSLIKIRPDLSVLFPHFYLFLVSVVIEPICSKQMKVCPPCQVLLKPHSFKENGWLSNIESHPGSLLFMVVNVTIVAVKYCLKFIRTSVQKWSLKLIIEE